VPDPIVLCRASNREIPQVCQAHFGQNPWAFAESNGFFLWRHS
jgi:hypothetical protein